jgi:glycosyltransferase involved in cell wall biosynthesis
MIKENLMASCPGKNTKIILIGPLPITGDAIGGAKISFQNLVDEFKRCSDTDLYIINTSRVGLSVAGRTRRAALNAVTMLKTLSVLVWMLSKYDAVLLNISAPAALKIVHVFAKVVSGVYRKPLYIRLFGGDLRTEYDRQTNRKQTQFRNAVRRSRFLYLETHTLVRLFKDFPNIAYWPNSRNMPARVSPLPNECRRALFLSQVKKSKGVPEILDAARMLGPAIEISIYGPMFDCEELLAPDSPANITYCGPVAPQDVPEVMEAHDLMLLPSHRAAEGYPGVLIEAAQLGLPLITSDLPNIGELVQVGRNGFTVPTGDAQALGKAILRIVEDPILFKSLQRGSIVAGERYRNKAVLSAILDQIGTDAVARKLPCVE